MMALRSLHHHESTAGLSEDFNFACDNDCRQSWNSEASTTAVSEVSSGSASEISTPGRSPAATREQSPSVEDNHTRLETLGIRFRTKGKPCELDIKSIERYQNVVTVSDIVRFPKDQILDSNSPARLHDVTLESKPAKRQDLGRPDSAVVTGEIVTRRHRNLEPIATAITDRDQWHNEPKKSTQIRNLPSRPESLPVGRSRFLRRRGLVDTKMLVGSDFGCHGSDSTTCDSTRGSLGSTKIQRSKLLQQCLRDNWYLPENLFRADQAQRKTARYQTRELRTT